MTVAWHGLPIGSLAHDGFEWRWSPAASGVPMPPSNSPDDADELAARPLDVLATPLGDHATAGVFTGTCAGPGRSAIAQDFERTLASIYQRADTPRLAGVQIKAPMTLAPDGRLSPSIGTPFTHVLKPAGTSGFEALPLVEWIGLALARAAGFTVPASALIAMPDGLPPALLVERFDIRTHANDLRLLAMEDLCSVFGLSP